MTTRRLTKRRAVLERHQDEVIALVVDGKSDVEIAAKYGCRRESVYLFRERHAVVLDELQQRVGQAVESVALANKINRIKDAAADYQRLGLVITARAADTRYDEPGYSTGLMVHELKSLGGGENATIVSQYKVDMAVVAERRALRRAVAEEMGDIGGETNAGGVSVVIRQVIGVEVSSGNG